MEGLIGAVVGGVVGAIIGGLFALLGGWLAIQWQSKHRAKSLAAAFLAEIEAIREQDKEGGGQRLHRDILETLEETGEFENRELLSGLFDYTPTEVAPVYYASVSEVGLLPEPLARSIIQYHSSSYSLLQAANRFLARDAGLSQDNMKLVGRALELRYDQHLDDQDAVVRKLREYLQMPKTPDRARVTATPRLEQATQKGHTAPPAAPEPDHLISRNAASGSQGATMGLVCTRTALSSDVDQL